MLLLGKNFFVNLQNVSNQNQTSKFHLVYVTTCTFSNGLLVTSHLLFVTIAVSLQPVLERSSGKLRYRAEAIVHPDDFFEW